MLMILEIWLTVSAWRKGWKGWAIVPGACVVAIAVFAAAGGADQTTLMGTGFVLDVLTVVALAVMVAVPRRQAEVQANPDLAAQPAPALAQPHYEARS